MTLYRLLLSVGLAWQVAAGAAAAPSARVEPAADPTSSPRSHSGQTPAAPRPSAAAGVSASYDQMNITAKAFELDGKNATITFTGSVHVDFRTTHIECNKAVVYSTRSADKVLKIVMSGSVLVQQKMGSFRGSTVTFFPDTERLLVEGNTQTKIKVQKGVPLFE